MEEWKIYTYPAPVLRADAEEIRDISEETQRLIDHMIEIMLKAPGIGLAANQVGELQRVIVFDKNPEESSREADVLINPEIISREGEITKEEACLSVVDFSADVTRSSRVKVQGVDRHGNPKDIEAEGLLAVCLQHEIDHLGGVLFIDHISRLKRERYKKKLKKMAK